MNWFSVVSLWFHGLIAFMIAVQLPAAFERGPMWWAVTGLVICIINFAAGVSYLCKPQKESP